jgi:thiamine-phosphate pyrophosphorylase
VSRLFGIYAIVDAAFWDDPERVVDSALRGGVRLVQYRAKAGVQRALLRRMHARTRAAEALLVVNDDLASAEDADGLHVGQEDLARLGAGLRERLGRRLLGVSCGLPHEAGAALRLGADYLGVGPFAETASKADAGGPIGPTGTSAVVRAAGNLPVAAIGGISLGNLQAVHATGARMAAVISALAGGDGPEASARSLVARWNELARRSPA